MVHLTDCVRRKNGSSDRLCTPDFLKFWRSSIYRSLKFFDVLQNLYVSDRQNSKHFCGHASRWAGVLLAEVLSAPWVFLAEIGLVEKKYSDDPYSEDPGPTILGVRPNRRKPVALGKSRWTERLSFLKSHYFDHRRSPAVLTTPAKANWALQSKTVS